MNKSGSPRITYLCIPCRFVSKHPGRCPKCSHDMRGIFDYALPRKHDDAGWKKVELIFYVQDSGLKMCECWLCRNYRSRPVRDMSLREYKADIRKRRTHPWQRGGVPRISLATGRYYRGHYRGSY